MASRSARARAWRRPRSVSPPSPRWPPARPSALARLSPWRTMSNRVPVGKGPRWRNPSGG